MTSVSAFPHGTVAQKGLVVNANTGDASKVRIGSTCYSGVRFGADGDEDNKGSGNSWNDAARGTYMTAGDPDDVWVERTVNSGSLNDEDAGTGRLRLTASRAFSISRGSMGVANCNVTFDFYNAASGGNLLDTVTINIIAEWG